MAAGERADPGKGLAVQRSPRKPLAHLTGIFSICGFLPFVQAAALVSLNLMSFWSEFSYTFTEIANNTGEKTDSRFELHLCAWLNAVSRWLGGFHGRF